MVKGTLAPEFGERFSWDLSAVGSPQDYQLSLVVKDKDTIGFD